MFISSVSPSSTLLSTFRESSIQKKDQWNSFIHRKPGLSSVCNPKKGRAFYYGYRLKSSRSFYRTFLLVFGLNRFRIQLLGSLFGISPFSKPNFISFKKKLGFEKVSKLLFLLDRPLKKLVDENLFLKRKSGHYVGLRYSLALPSRGQRTKSNARTSKRRAGRKFFKKLILIHHD